MDAVLPHVTTPPRATNLSAVNAIGPAGLFVYIAIAHASLIVYALIRMAVRPTVPREERVRYKPEMHPMPAGPVDYSQSSKDAPLPAKV